MRAYTEDFPIDATLDLVFRDLHAKANTPTRVLDALVDHRGGESNGRQAIPDTPLWVAWNGLEGRGGYSYLTNIVQVQISQDLRPLTEVSSYLPRTDGVWEPTRIGGNRDYVSWAEASMSRQEGKRSSDDVIMVRLGDSGIRGAADDLVGTTRERAGTRLDELPDGDLRRVEIVSQSILGDIAVIELIREGTAPEEALRMIDRPIARV